MKKVEINYPQLLFLYAYLRMIDLSVDRSRWNLWPELKYYFKNRITPAEVTQYLMNTFLLSKGDLEGFAFSPVKRYKINRLKSVIFKRLTLKREEIIYCYKLLSDFDDLLRSDNQTYNLEIEKLRIDVARYYNGILGSVILAKDLNRLMRIAHFQQSDRIDVLDLDYFIPDDFLIE